MVSPHTHADETDGYRRAYHHRVTEYDLAREDGDDFRSDSEGGNYEYIYLRMSKDPEEVHPENGGTAGHCVEEVAPEVTVDQQHQLRCGERANREKQKSR